MYNHNNRMKKKLQLTVVVAFSLLFAAKAQEASHEKTKSEISLEGMVGVSFGNNFYALNVGGPALFLVLNPDLKIGIGALPSIYLLNGKAGARLGVSPRIDYKNLVFIAPFYHRDTTGEWIWSVGMGYKFHKKN